MTSQMLAFVNDGVATISNSVLKPVMNLILKRGREPDESDDEVKQEASFL